MTYELFCRLMVSFSAWGYFNAVGEDYIERVLDERRKLSGNDD